MRFAPDFLDRIRSIVPVSQVAGQKVKLKRAGKEWVGLSPFSKEKTPSFYCSDPKAMFFDFSAGKTGDIFSFIMMTEGLTFPEAVEKLAAIAGVAIPRDDPDWERRETRKAELGEVLEAANDCFREWLRGRNVNHLSEVNQDHRNNEPGGGEADRAGRAASAYLAQRGLGVAEIERFEIGYAPADRSFLKQRLSPTYGADALAEAGLVITGDDVPVSYDRFRGRIMFPIRDHAGKLIGFGGRVLDDTRPKYLNSPETEIFHKGHVLYNAHRARQPAHDGATVVVVEGYTAAIASVRAGFEATVATLGTAMTDAHLLAMWRLSDAPVIALDGDQAGRRAAAKAVETALPMLLPGRTLRFATMPSGEDPDDVVSKRGAPAFNRLIQGAIGLADMIWRVCTAGRSMTTPDEMGSVEADMVGMIQTIPDNQLRDKYLRHVRDRVRQVPRTRPRLVRSNGHSFHSASPGALRLVHGMPARSAMTLKEAALLAAVVAAPMVAVEAAELIVADPTISVEVRNAASGMVSALAGMASMDDCVMQLTSAGFGDVIQQAYTAIHAAGITSLEPGGDQTKAMAVLKRG